jgi:hypothetical protein
MAIITDEGDGLTTFFYGFVREVEFRVGGAVVVTDDNQYILASDKDEGLPHLRADKKQQVVISYGRIKAVFVRPRIVLFQLFGAGKIPSHRFLARLRPKYLASESSRERPPRPPLPPHDRFSDLYD